MDNDLHAICVRKDEGNRKGGVSNRHAKKYCN